MEPKFLRAVRRELRKAKRNPKLMENAKFASKIQEFSKKLTPEYKAKYARYGVKFA